METQSEATETAGIPDDLMSEMDIGMIQVRMIPPIFIASLDDGIAYASVTDGKSVVAFPVAKTTMRLVEAFMRDESGNCAGESKLDGRSGCHFRDAVAISVIAKPIGLELEVTEDRIVPYMIHPTDKAITLTPVSLNMMLSLHVVCGVPIVVKKEAFDEASVPIPDDAIEWKHKDQSLYYMKIIGPRLPKVDMPTDLPEGLAPLFYAAERNKERRDNQDEAPAATA